MQFLISLLLLFAFNVLADSVVTTQVHDIDLGREDESTFVYLMTGQVVSLGRDRSALLSVLQRSLETKAEVRIELSDRREILSVEVIPWPKVASRKAVSTRKLLAPLYTPSILKDLDTARGYFSDARRDYKSESQCYNRAHVWTYEWRTKKNLYSNKVWLFFTRRFIRKYKFEWWFHVAPMVHVVVDNKVRQRVMDIKYARGPLPLKQWTDIFLRDDADCPVVQKYSDQADSPETGSCFVMKSSMYDYQPVDLEAAENSGESKWQWLRNEVVQAYDEAFGVEIGD